MDASKMHKGKARKELHKNATCGLKQILETTLLKTAVGTATHLPSHKPSK